MRIVRLQAEGFKRLAAVDITPEPHLNRVGGNNEEGKTSLLDSIFAAIGGAEAAPIKPVRTGEEYAIIRLDMGELRVTRYFDADGTTKLKVENAEGAEYGKAQSKLDELVGAITFDPLAFANMAAKDQAAELRRLVKLDVDLDELAAADRRDYAERREVNRDGVQLKSRLDAIILPAELPEPVDKDAIVAELAGAAETNSALDRESRDRAERARTIEQRKADAAEARATAGRLRKEAEDADALAAMLDKGTGEREAELAALPPLDEPVDVADVQRRLAEAERTVAVLARKADRDRLAEEFAALKAKSEGLTATMARRQEEREKALAAAKMPIEGLGFATIDDELVVTFNGEPFSQSSGAQRIKVSTALAIAANPKLRVCRIKDGSLLDAKNMAALADMAREHDFQIWLETVGEDGAGIIMEAGAVKGAPDPERVEPPKRRKKAEAAETGGDLKVVHDHASDEPNRFKVEGIAEAKEAAKRKPQAMREFSTPKPEGSLL